MKKLYIPQEIFNGSEYILPALPYAYDALEPHIDEATVRLHHDKHHAAYVAGANAASAKIKEIADGGDPALMTHWVRQLSFHVSGHVLHSILWNNMTPSDTPTKPCSKLQAHIDQSFGSLEATLKVLKATAVGVEGSGWAILGYDTSTGLLRILGIEKHQNLTTSGLVPLLVVDVWEHAYYLKHQNNRAGHVDDYLSIINWDDVSARLKAAIN